ncbi:MAG: UvrD-helicase domain-containing protein, partial [Myxococcales bacterium]|nr:UvrD-helicase domain-containing protein [Myxococcales bacterium]
MTLKVIRAAAGCGKTTALATAYLELVSTGVPVDRIIAITFTRRAAAELVERVGLALRAATGDVHARERLGHARDAYLAAAPSDREIARDALADLGSAPIGTTDHFVNLLLAEYALDAEIELPDGRVLPLDVGLVPVPDLSAHLDAAARRILDPPDSEPPPEVETLARYFSLGEILQLVCSTSGLDGMPGLPCSKVLKHLAVQVARLLEPLDLQQLLEVPADTLDAWRGQVELVTLPGAEWTLDPVSRWLASGGAPPDAPLQLVSWARKIDGRRKAGKALKNAFRDASLDFGITDVRVDHVLAALRHPYEDPAHLRLADELRAAVESLRVRVTSDAVESAALQGELPHTHLTRAATRLARKPVLTGRFGALLVDEVQDADPDQLALYEALAAQPDMQSVFVGDGRQSIYLFRGGEPAGLARLSERGTESEPRLVNYRSTPGLVSAHRALFAALDDPMRRQFFAPLEALDQLQHEPALAGNALSPDHHADPRPVWVVKANREQSFRLDDHVLVAFWERLRDAWREPGHAHDSAAVLCPTWGKALHAASLLRKLAADEEAAWVEGGDTWLAAGVGADVGLWLRALLDPSDDVAWLAVWKHPSIGLTDGALARIRKGIGVGDRGWATDLGAVARIPRLERPHRDDDIAAFAQAREPLLAALADIGRDDTSLVLDRLVTAMGWRTLLAASPGGLDEVARLEVLLDWIGELDAQGASVDAIASMLSADSRSDVPRVRLERPER